MMPAKYIIIDKIYPVIFHSGIEHVDEAAGRNVTSAGFIKISIEEPVGSFDQGPARIKVTCSGKSTSLGGIKSNPDRDAKLIRAMLTEE